MSPVSPKIASPCFWPSYCKVTLVTLRVTACLTSTTSAGLLSSLVVWVGTE